MHRILIIGVGSIGERHARCMLNTKRAVVGICEPNDKLRGDIAAKYGITEAFGALDDALTRPWDAAVIATPAPLHIPIAQKLADAGIHLLIEKPLAITTDGIERLMQTVRERNLVAVVAYVHRAHPLLRAMRDAIFGGRFGRPVQVAVVIGQHFPFYRPAYRQTYYTNHAQGGGAIQDAITHMFNAVEWLVGPITRLAADAAHQVLEGVTVEDTVNVICRHGDNVLGSYTLNQHQAPNEATITVICDKGTCRYELHENRWRWMTEPSSAWHDEAVPAMERDDWFTGQENLFLDALERKCEPLCTLQEGLQTLKVNIAALASSAAGGGMRAV